MASPLERHASDLSFLSTAAHAHFDPVDEDGNGERIHDRIDELLLSTGAALLLARAAACKQVEHRARRNVHGGMGAARLRPHDARFALRRNACSQIWKSVWISVGLRVERGKQNRA